MSVVALGEDAERGQLHSRITFFEHLPALAQYLPFSSWDALFDFMLEGLKPVPRKAKTRVDTGRGQIWNC